MDIVGHRSLRDLLLEREARCADKTFLTFVAADGTHISLSYAEFGAGVRGVAAGLARLGVGKGDKVVVHLGNCPEFLLCWFGVAWLGAVLVPSNTANTERELRHVAEHAEAVAVVTAAGYRELVERALPPEACHRILVGGQHPGWVDFAELTTATDPPMPPLASADLAELLFTSGTTAAPKATMLTHANCLFAGEREWRTIGIDSSDRSLTALPVFHVNAQTVTILSALTAGATVVLLEEYSASRFWEQVRDTGATVLALVAMQLRTLLAQPPAPTDREHGVRRVMYALNVPEREKTEFERRFGVELINGYGLSEAMTIVTAAPVHGEKRWPSIGLPAIDRRVRVVLPDGTDAAPGEVGEIVVGGEPGRNLMLGYYRDPAATEAVLREGWLYTGDNGYLDEHGYLYFFDRRKDVIKVAGENVSATEVEQVLCTHPAVAEAAVIGVPDSVRDEAVKAFVVPKPDCRLTEESVVEHCAERLARFKVPTLVEIRENLPKTSIGKIEKKLLRAEQAAEAVR
ncbi:crotonobetaine/carnitine-CoA ligase [Prauserella shujinwangii]|uniref:Crotonobetaine/carnitine-CoA ligase n=1 Tax=Prauserella shujinwangii TaxID=1453103 RepID=A0A2T0M1J4_9PSEU|nr:AMP-binding protein [Prauserella shujinwangii]PRX50458.1 crotonobetaine/carnitine-CoA ligase [Prauserella shujinwangii]